MRNLLANIANAWVRGTLHALNSVLFAKYLSLALGIDAASAALLGGCASGVVIMRGRLVSTGLAAVRLFRSGGNDLEAALRGSEEEPENEGPRSGSGDGDIQKKFCESLGMHATDFVEQMWLDHYNSNKTTWWRVRPVGCPVGLSEYQTVVLFVLQKNRVDWRAPLSHTQAQEAEAMLASALEYYDYKP